MYEGDTEVGYFFVVHALDCGGIVLSYLLASCILPHLLVSRVKGVPLREPAHTEIVFVVVEQLFETGFRHVGELDFGLGGGGCGLVAFGDVLFAATCGLNHLVDSAVAFGEVVLGEVVGDVIDYLGDLVDPEVAVVAVLGEEGGGRGVRIVRSTLSVLNILSIQSILVVLVVLV